MLAFQDHSRVHIPDKLDQHSTIFSSQRGYVENIRLEYLYTDTEPGAAIFSLGSLIT
jgi:hypothetical protein